MFLARVRNNVFKTKSLSPQHSAVKWHRRRLLFVCIKVSKYQKNDTIKYMHKYYFIFGKTPQLSLAEIKNVLFLTKIEFKQILQQNELFIIESKEKIDNKIFYRLGGQIKFGEIIGQIQRLNANELIKTIDLKQTNKIQFGISDYTNQKLKINKLGIEIKKIIKQSRPCRFVSPKTQNLTAVVVKKNKLIDQGIELCIFEQRGIFLIGKTLAVQDFELWNKLDYGRPEFDPKIGMLPPKVAQMMINLIPQKTKTIWDPFCGFGTILQQAAILGYENIFGSDINASTILKAQKNIDWLLENFNLTVNIEMKTLDITKATAKDLKFLPQAIVTEPYLGKPLTGKENQADLNKIKKELQLLYLKSFEKFSKLLGSKHIVVFIFPKLKSKKQIIDTSIDENIKQLGYNLLNEFDYSRPGQHLVRRITIWKIAVKR